MCLIIISASVTVSNSKHWFTTSFLQGRCRKTVLGVCGGVCLYLSVLVSVCLSVCLSDHSCGCRSVCFVRAGLYVCLFRFLLLCACVRFLYMSVCLSVYVWCIGSDVIVDLKKYDSSIVLSLSSSSCLPPLYYHCHRQHAFLHCIIIVVIMLSSIVLSLSSSSCLPPLYYHCRHHAFLHCIIIVIVIMPSSSPFYFFLAKNLFTNSQDLLFPFFFLLSSVSSLFSSLFSCSQKSVSLVVVVVFPC